MSVAVDNSGRWSRTRWLLTVLGMLGLQVSLIFALGERTPPKPRAVGALQTLQLTAARTELQALLDPTLFARPHARDFSATSWLRVLPPTFPVFQWTEPVRPLELPMDQLGQTLSRFLRTNFFANFSLEARPDPDMMVRRPETVLEAIRAKSQLAVTGELGRRTLLNPPDLPAWPADDLLTNTLVQVLVDESGCVLTAAQLGAERLSGGSGSASADRLALTVARDLRFAPASSGGWFASPAAQLTRGVLVFQWRTERATNGVPEARPNP